MNRPYWLDFVFIIGFFAPPFLASVITAKWLQFDFASYLLLIVGYLIGYLVLALLWARWRVSRPGARDE